MSTNPHQLFLLADHLKLSLLERQRAVALNLEPNKQDSHITRSLDTLREGLEKLERQRSDSETASEDTSALSDQTQRLRLQYQDLSAQFHGSSATPTSPSLTRPNDATLTSDFSSARARPNQQRQSSVRQQKSPTPKSVRFRDNPSTSPVDENRAALFPYRDDPDDAPTDHSGLDNQQIRTYHKQVIRDQDEQLETLGKSIGRQRDLSIQMGTELDEQALILDEVDQDVDRHTGTLDRARNRLGGISRKAKDNWNWVTIAILIIILVLLIVVFK